MSAGRESDGPGGPFPWLMVNWGVPPRKTKPGTRKWSWRWVVLVTATVVGLTAAGRAEAAPCGTPGNNEIVVENLSLIHI